MLGDGALARIKSGFRYIRYNYPLRFLFEQVNSDEHKKEIEAVLALYFEEIKCDLLDRKRQQRAFDDLRRRVNAVDKKYGIYNVN